MGPMLSTKDDIRVVPLGVMARLCHVPSKWLRAEAEAGRIPALKAGDRLVFRPDVVLPLVAERAAQRGAGS
jgi:hypothetical protein